MNDYAFAGIELTGRVNGEGKDFVTLEELILCSHSNREIIFTFRHSFTPPAWLKRVKLSRSS